MSGNNTQNAAIPDKHHIEIGGKSPYVIEMGKVQ